MGQPVVHFELWSQDPGRVGAFYTRAFGWSVQHLPEINYWLTDNGANRGINGGIMRPQDGPWPGNMCFYIDVPRLDEAVEQVRAAGGRIVVERREMPGVGAFALFEDPDGRVNGIWEQLVVAKPRRRSRSTKKRPARPPRARRRRR